MVLGISHPHFLYQYNNQNLAISLISYSPNSESILILLYSRNGTFYGKRGLANRATVIFKCRDSFGTLSLINFPNSGNDSDQLSFW